MTLPESKIGSLYVRVSSHDQDELSPDAQIRLGLDYAKANNIIVPKEYIFTESISGRKVKNRREFQKMIALAKSPDHPFDVIIVWKFSRFARNQEESIVYKSMLRKDNVDVVSISEPQIEGPFGSLIERIIEWMDEYYSIRLSGEVLRGMNEKALRNGYQISPPLGYQAVGNGKPFVIDEKEYKIVEYMSKQFDTYGKDCTAIARSLNNMGYRTKRGGLFEKRSVERILTNPFYYGLVKWNDTSFIGSHEVRLTKEQYEKRMNLIRSRHAPARRRNVSTCTHWLSGLLKCGYCGASLVYNGVNRSPGFQCWRYAKGFHDGSSSISEKKVLAAIYEYFEQILSGSEFTYTYHAPETEESDNRRASLLEDLEKISSRERRIRLAFENEVDTLEEYKENKERLKMARKQLEQELAELDEAPVINQPSKEEVLSKVRTVYDLIKDPDVDRETKGIVMRGLFESITYDKENQKLEFILYIS